MARPSRGGFAKREKERARFEKRQSKLARRHKKADDGLPGGADAPVPDPEAGEGDVPDQEDVPDPEVQDDTGSGRPG